MDHPHDVTIDMCEVKNDTYLNGSTEIDNVPSIC